MAGNKIESCAAYASAKIKILLIYTTKFEKNVRDGYHNGRVYV